MLMHYILMDTPMRTFLLLLTASLLREGFFKPRCNLNCSGPAQCASEGLGLNEFIARNV